MSEANSEYAEVAEMFRRLKSLDENSAAFRRQRDSIVERALPLADHIARRYKNRGEPIDDLVQAARVGLVNAVNRFDPDNGADFLSFAVPTMMGEVRRHFRDYGWAVKVPRRLKDLQSQLVKARAELSQQIGRAPTASEVANHLGIEREAVMEATIASSNYATLSTDIPATADDEHRSVGDTLGGLDPNIDKVVELEAVRPLIAALPDRERMVLTLRFFESMTQTQIAERMGYSQMHVSRLLAQALRRLRDQLRDQELGEEEPTQAAASQRRRPAKLPIARSPATPGLRRGA
ncbi:SigB/SigF/SigG family RNA polymerase sigma factor [Mycobacterium sp. IDR2000157661]|uniref:SigB/SigF/SigG family RNA polymerase sigma factor n=1 Tax=Mycobacterium sp. IDR2000157661 TaxID=2867005 RepID=UPI00272E2E13|nr:SigB/SigF/SigG family RNA polymerase sigma factor [Mycobacterium sp. IDR2000157661]ULE33377.1 SigB/SigF/SigG family RNA polymerase sigma factor [Mycobacterium sp. IDR2000157661]